MAAVAAGERNLGDGERLSRGKKPCGRLSTYAPHVGTHRSPEKTAEFARHMDLVTSRRCGDVAQAEGRERSLLDEFLRAAEPRRWPHPSAVNYVKPAATASR